MTHHPLLDETVQILSDLIAFPSVSEDSNLELIAYINYRLDQIAARTYLTLDPTGSKANLFATLGPIETDGGIVLSGHTDVVPVEGQDWSTDPFKAEIRDGRLYGRGSCDMKGFLACTLALAPHFMEMDLKRPLHLAFTYDEEVGCLGAQTMLKELAETGPLPTQCIVGEPTRLHRVEGHKGCCEYTTSFIGLEGHGSVPERGVNAIHFASRFVTRLIEISERLRKTAPDTSRFEPKCSTIQVGRMTGGIARNIIAGSCAVEWELRNINKDDYAFAHQQIREFTENELLPEMQAIWPDAGIFTEVIGEVSGLEPMTYSNTSQLLAELTGNDTPAECVSFSTEAGLFQALGMDTIICGPGSIAQAHKPDEFIELEQLSQCLYMLEGLKHHL